MTDDDWIDAQVAAQQFKVPERSLRRFNLPSRKVGRRVQYRQGDIQAAIESKAAADRNLDQHARRRRGQAVPADVSRTLARPGAPYFGGNLYRSVSYATAVQIAEDAQHTIATIAAQDDWAQKFNVEPEALGAIIAGVALAVAEAAHIAATTSFEDRFPDTDQLSAAVADRKHVFSVPPTRNDFPIDTMHPSMDRWLKLAIAWVTKQGSGDGQQGARGHENAG